MVAVPIAVFREGILQPWSEAHGGSSNPGASTFTGAGRTSPEVLGSVNTTGAGSGVQGANVRNSDTTSQEIVEVKIHLRGSVDRNIHLFVTDDVARDAVPRAGVPPPALLRLIPVVPGEQSPEFR